MTTLKEIVVKKIIEKVELIKNGKTKLSWWNIVKKARYNEAIKNYKDLAECHEREFFPDRPYDPENDGDTIEVLTSPAYFDT